VGRCDVEGAVNQFFDLSMGQNRSSVIASAYLGLQSSTALSFSIDVLEPWDGREIKYASKNSGSSARKSSQKACQYPLSLVKRLPGCGVGVIDSFLLHHFH